MASRTFKLRDVCSVLSGFAFKSNFFSDAGMPLIRIRDVVRGFTETCYAGDYDEKYVVQNGDILIGMDGDFNLEYWEGGAALLNQRVCKVTPDESVLNKAFLYYFLPLKLKEIWEATPYVTVKHLSSKDVEGIEISAWPIATQKHIARVLEQADQLRKQAQQMERELNQLAQSLFLEMFGDYRRQSDDRFVPLTTVADVVSGVAKGSDMKGKQTRVVPYIRVANVQDGFLNLSEIKEIEATERDIEKYVLQPGDILMTEGGDFDKLGRGAMWSDEVKECIHQNHIFRVRFSNAYEPKFFEYYLRSSKAKLYFLRCAKQTTNLASINMTQLKALPIPKEGRKKQEQFVAALELIERQIKTVKSKGEYLEQAFQALMQRAFNGELTAPERKAA